MSLSFWNFESHFTARQAALLAIGVDPLVEDISTQLAAKVAMVQREIEWGAELAISLAERILNGGTEDYSLTPDIWEMFGIGIELPSLDLRCFVSGDVLKGNGFCRKQFQAQAPEPRFERSELERWFINKKIKPAYNFGSPEQIEIDLRICGNSPDIGVSNSSQMSANGRDHFSKEINQKGDVAEKSDFVANHGYKSNKLAYLNQAALIFWARSDPGDRSTHSDNSAVAEWLMSKGYSKTMAEKGASIIRPEWASVGRKPEE